MLQHLQLHFLTTQILMLPGKPCKILCLGTVPLIYIFGACQLGFLFVAFLAGEQDCCLSQTHLFPLLIHNLEPQPPVISLSLRKIITVGGQYNGLFTGVFLDIKSTIWGLVPEKWQIILCEFNIIMSKLGLILISLGSTFTHSSWSWLIFLECEAFCDIFYNRGNLERKVL